MLLSKIKHNLALLACFSGVLFSANSMADGVTEGLLKEPKKPNILFIVADDLGYSDLGSFGGEIDTPTLDALADSGVRLTSFHTAPTCSPTRSMLMTGVDSHRAGLGNMAEVIQPNQKGKPGYEGYLNTLVATFPEVLQNAGYHTYMAGKWHLGRNEEQSPKYRGFDQSYALIQGGASHFDDQRAIIARDPRAIYRENGKSVDVPKGFFSSEFYTDKLIEYIDNNIDDDKPFFAYAAYTAPHWPLQAPDAYIEKYQGKYDQGYAAIRQSRLARMQELGIVAPDLAAHVALDSLPDWQQLTPEQRQEEARRMEVYAAMVDNMDFHIGRLLKYLESKGELDNTIILFMSDNGADGNSPEPLPGNKEWYANDYDNSLANMGRKNSFIWYGPQWGQVGATPFPLYKGFTSQGGVIAPAIIKFPQQQQAGRIEPRIVSVLDIMPTFLDLIGVDQPGETFNGRKVFPIQGISLATALQSGEPNYSNAQRTIGWELFGRRALRQGDWKIRLLEPPYGKGEWELFDLANDPLEFNDLAAENPAKLAELLQRWQEYIDYNGVVVSDLEKMKRIGYSFKTCHYDHCIN